MILKTRLFLHEERRCFGDDGVDNGAWQDLKVRIRDLSRQISALPLGELLIPGQL